MAASGLMLASCADDYKETIPMPEKPEDVKLTERLSAYGLLSEYASQAGLQLGVCVGGDDFASHGMLYGIVHNNFGYIESSVKLVPMSMWTPESTYDFSTLSTLVDAAAKADMPVFGPVLCTESNIPASYLKSVIADEVIPYKPWSELILVSDFENDEVGTKYPSVKKKVGAVNVEVVEDPLGQQGKVLQGSKLTMDIPMVADVKLPDGFTLSDISRVKLKCLLIDGTPTSSRIQIESAGANEKGNPYQTKNEWRDYVFDLSNIKFKDSELASNTISIALGDYGSGVTCCIDDIYIQLEHSTGDDTVITKTPEEKEDIISGELYGWVRNLTDICGTTVKNYIIVDEPLDDEFANFHWGDYITGNYIAGIEDSVKSVAGADARFYVSQTLSLGETMPEDVNRLHESVTALENKGVAVHGINIVLDATYNLDYPGQIVADQAAVKAIRSLTLLGKPVRVSGFRMKVLNESGIQINPSTMTVLQRQAVAEYYQLIISEFISALGQNAEAFSFSSAVDTATDAAPWLQNGNRNFIYEGIVKGLSVK